MPLHSQELIVRRVLILAPTGRDAENAQLVLTRHGFSPVIASSLDSLSSMLDEQVGAVLITSEALRGPGVDRLEKALGAQPAWSDPPFVYLTPKQTGLSSDAERLRRSWPSGMTNVMVLERPLSSESLASAIHWALTMRQRQFQVRDQFEKLAEREPQLVASQRAERKAALRREFIFHVAESQRAAKSPEAIMAATAQALAQYMNVDRAGFYTLNRDAQSLSFGPSHAALPWAPLTGAIAVKDIGAAMTDRLSTGQNVLVRGVTDHHVLEGTVLQKLGVVSVIGVPFMAEGRWAAGVYVHQMSERHWSDEDVSLVEEVARLTWDAIERAKAGQALAASEARFRGMIDSIDQMVWSTRPDGHHDYYNERWYAYTGVPLGTTDGEAWNGVFHPEDQPRAWAIWRHSLDTGKPYRIEYRLRHHSGQYRWVLGRAQAVRDDKGVIVRWFGTCTDIQDIVDAREVLARSREDMAREVAVQTQERDRIWQVSRDLLGVADIQGVWLSVNPAWRLVLGWPPEDIIGRTSEWLEHPDDRQETRAEIAGLAAGRVTHAYENRFRASDGQYKLLEWRAVALDGKIYAVARDITEQRAQQLTLQETEERLRQAQKMEAVGQLTGGIAHDFNNMLQGIISALAVAKQSLKTQQYERLPRALDIAERSAFKAGNLTHRLLAFSRRQPLNPKPLDGNALILSMEDLLRRTGGENIRLVFSLDPAAWAVHCDENQLENALLNLVINARAAMPDGGTISIATHNVHDHAVPQALTRQRVDCLRIDVIDSGCGMPPDVMKRAFEPFFTTKPLGQGTGLGLSMIYGFAQQSGGACEIQSEVGRGTQVHLYLPRHDPATSEPPASPGADALPSDDAPPSFKRRTVLVVEDEDFVRELVVEALCGLGLEVMQAGHSEQALTLLDTGVRFELLVTDVGLPGLNGRQVAEIARQRLPQIRVLFMTGYADGAGMPTGSIKPGMALIVKPFDMAGLTARVSTLLAETEPLALQDSIHEQLHPDDTAHGPLAGAS
ncbi:MAG: PAS domain S-box protein [Cupriavidus sp.]|nr:MAG: PAS domain S-box protein [Cupriavidus sp.]